jgi:multisubunit Na+/H+ antiporter MnhG subunit
MNNNRDVDEKKWRRLDITVGCIADVIAIWIAMFVSEKFFDGSMWAGLIVVIIAALILNAVKSAILTAIYRSDSLRRHFDKTE